MSYFRVRAKARKSAPSKELKGIGIILLSFLLLYCMVLPSSLGIVGKQFKAWFFYAFGQAAFVLPLLLAAYGIQTLRDKKVKSLEIMLSVVAYILLCGFFSVISLVGEKNFGGFTGKLIRDFFVQLFGPAGSGIILGVVILYIASMLLRISLIDLAKNIFTNIAKDVREWRSSVELSKKTGVPARKQSELPKKITINASALIKTPLAAVPAVNTAQKQKTVITQPQQSKPVPAQKTVQEIKRPAPEYEKEYKLPPLELLKSGTQSGEEYKQEELISKAALLEKTLASFGVSAKVTEINPGPTITRYDLTPDAGVKVQQITALSNDIALAMKTISVRIIAPVPGKAAVGIEIPNTRGRLVSLKDIVSTNKFTESKSKLSIAIGQTIDGNPCIANIISMPHLLVAGATGSGKSVCIHSIISSILFKARPDEVKLLLIDPKRLELPAYNGLPHIYDPTVHSDKVQVITQPKHAARALSQLVKVMEKRYEKFAKVTVRNIEGYNEYAQKNGLEKEYYILVIIDELADLMLIMQKEVEDAIQRLAQMARAVGIHLILATQRPSVDVITGVIKANLSARIAFQVLSKTDSRVILDVMGAEDLLGSGDMLYLATGEPKPVRLQGAYISESEIVEIVNFIKKQGFKPYYEELTSKIAEEEKNKDDENIRNALVQALGLIQERRRVSQDLLKAHFGSSARATDILSLLEVRGFIFKPEGTNKWSIHFDKIEEYLREGK